MSEGWATFWKVRSGQERRNRCQGQDPHMRDPTQCRPTADPSPLTHASTENNHGKEHRAVRAPRSSEVPFRLSLRLVFFPLLLFPGKRKKEVSHDHQQAEDQLTSGEANTKWKDDREPLPTGGGPARPVGGGPALPIGGGRPPPRFASAAPLPTTPAPPRPSSIPPLPPL